MDAHDLLTQWLTLFELSVLSESSGSSEVLGVTSDTPASQTYHHLRGKLTHTYVTLIYRTIPYGRMSSHAPGIWLD